MLKTPRFDLHVYQQHRGLHHHPRNETTLSPVVNTPASKQAETARQARSHLLQPTKPTLLTPNSLPRARKSVSSASDPASRLLQPGCNMNTRRQEYTFITEGPPPPQTQNTFDDSRQSEGLTAQDEPAPVNSNPAGRKFGISGALQSPRGRCHWFQTGPPMVTVGTMSDAQVSASFLVSLEDLGLAALVTMFLYLFDLPFWVLLSDRENC
jgi:hypothetical protein